MQLPNHITAMLSMMERPAFCVSGGIIAAANEGALGRLVPVGEPVEPLLTTGKAEYAAFTGGQLCLTLNISGTDYDATVSALDGFPVFSLEAAHADEQLKVLSLAAQQLRNPLSSVKAMMDQLLPKLEDPQSPQTDSQLSYLYRSLNQMQRIIYNMSDTDRYSSTPARGAVRDINAVLTELFDSAAELCRHAGITLRYTGLSAPAYTMLDTERLERCIYNILSNSMKHTAPGCTVQISLTKKGSLLFLTVEDSGSGVDLADTGNLYTRYLREPGLDSLGSGLGLGMALIRSCAKAHGGSVLITSTKGSGLKLTMTLRVQTDSSLSGPSIPFDYAGDQNHGLIELSDVLPPELYNPHRN